MAGALSSQPQETSSTNRVWTHIKVLYILCILLSAVVLALFVVCFMMVLEVQQGLNAEVTTRKERENKFLRSVFTYDEETGVPRASSQKSMDNPIEVDSQIHVTKDGGTEIKMNSAALTRFCVSIHSHCPSKGPTGPPGLPGLSVKGDQGVVGLRGYPGAQGVSGPPGLQGPKGEIGAPGYGIPGMAGSDGRKGEKGNIGEKGEMGPMGLQGDIGIGTKGQQGQKGDRGLTGTNGLSGLTGSAGPKGDPGEKGNKGDEGLDGVPGIKGIAGFPGSAGQKGEKGEKGGSIFTEGSVSVVDGQKGEPGLPGLPGLPGTSGVPGPKGETGKNGEVGPPGIYGEPGIQGPPGFPGLDGIKGERGPFGVEGRPGPKGEAGFNGAKGEPGALAAVDYTKIKITEAHLANLNLTFLKGANGPNGAPGPRGRRGKPGDKGATGDVQQCECHAGPPGPKGDPGKCKGVTPSFVLYQNTTIPARSKDATISRLGKPLLYVNLDNEWGGWMVDSDPTPTTAGKFYVTQHFTGSTLQQYNSYPDLVDKRSAKAYVLQDLYYGTNGVVYKGAFFYHRAGLNQIGRFDLEHQGLNAQLTIDNSLHQGSESLFSTEYNFYDLSVDGNGLWVLYAYKSDGEQHAESDTLIVAKLDPNYLKMEKTWNITVNRMNYANAFIVEGIVYLLESGTKDLSSISYAYDLYEMKERPVNIRYSNVFKGTKMLAYDDLKKALMSYDNGRILSIPLLTQNVN